MTSTPAPAPASIPTSTSTHMAAEVMQAPEVVARMLNVNRVALAELGKLVRRHQPTHFITCARGSSDHAASYFKYLLELSLGLPCCSVGASVVSIYGTRLHLQKTLLLVISQSGRSPDILAFQAEARRAGTTTIAITNDADSPLAQQADICLPLCAGPEHSVAATKTFIASAALAAAIVAACSDDSGLKQAVLHLPQDLSAATLGWDGLEEVAVPARSLYVLGRGPSLPMAQEAALKLKETSGLHAEAHSAAEVLHGPMELVQEGFPVLVFAARRDAAAASTAATVLRLQQAGARVVQLPHQETLHRALDPIAMIQTFYASAERLSRLRGRNPDAPRLLQKVTRTL